MAEKARCEICDRTFKDLDGLRDHNRAKHPDKKLKNKKSFPIKKFRNWGIFILILIVVFGGIMWGALSVKTLPPTTMQGHVEVNPPSHVMREPMLLEVQKHMLEHSDGVGPPGIIINYNCEDYECEEGLIENLESFAEKYSTNVYVAPFKGMDAKIALTRLGKIEVLKEYDENLIENFIFLI